MAYEHGSLDLGIRNPFRFEGVIRAIRGLLTTALGAVALLSVTADVAENHLFGIVTAAVGFLLLANGLWALGSGLMQTLRFFVGRSVPTSLAFNHAKSEADSANAERHDVAYSAEQMEQMLVGRKNLTFSEPQGLISRLIHTLFPKLTFVPYPIRNMAQQLTDTVAQTVLALLAYGLASFVLATGLIGDNGSFIQPLVSFMFLAYLLIIWFTAGRPISRQVAYSTLNRGAAGIARTLVLAVTLPLAAGLAINWLMSTMFDSAAGQALFGPIEQIRSSSDVAMVSVVTAIYDNVSLSMWLLALALLALLSVALLAVLVGHRCGQASPITEVSELRENWQESVHPREIFINLDSMVLANRRYKEVPNRVYRQLMPMLKEQANGKGAFYGETIQETQPRVKPMPMSGLPKQLRIAGTCVGQLLMLGCALVLFSQYDNLFALIQLLQQDLPEHAGAQQLGTQTGELIALLFNSVLALMVLGLFGRLLTNLTHVFWSEIQFESQLIYFKCEGTFTESTVSTGKGIYDSTQSENVIVRSSMTPWVIVAKAVSCTFAGVGSKNLEQPRHLMELHSDEADMVAIVDDLRGYLASRQTIANLNTMADLEAAEQIHQLNQQTRAMSLQQPAQTTAALGANQQFQLDDKSE
ncbi:hypothetical protein [Ferrimonas senticii]|uniref:hypothetical protein n=1 Tax=Ferrimonas senticii TaxID=394566 RepID=UPI00040C760A|nr:hypothetical protein [Ferrimonas senticii]